METQPRLIFCRSCKAPAHLLGNDMWATGCDCIPLELMGVRMKTANSFLLAASRTMIERGEQYDKSTGERSMAACVAAFNAVTGKDLSESEGWLIMLLLKMVRQWQNPAVPHEDSLMDGVAYASLLAESYMEAKK